MKILRYLTYSLALMLMIASCDKHELQYNTTPVTGAEFQLHYFVPVSSTATAYAVDSVMLNGVQVSSVKGAGQLKPQGSIPGSGYTGRFFSVKAGETNIKFYKGGNVIYDQNVTLTASKQNVIVHDLDKAPIVIDNQYPYQHVSGIPNVTTWDTDSLQTVMFINLLYEKAGEPYKGKLQYQWQHPTTKEWKDLGTPVGFGEATERTEVRVIKTTHNSEGSCRIDYRILTEDREVLQILNSGVKYVDYSDWWTGYIGRAYMHFYRGVRTEKGSSGVTNWTSL